jgi:hypothetical protein
VAGYLNLSRASLPLVLQDVYVQGMLRLWSEAHHAPTHISPQVTKYLDRPCFLSSARLDYDVTGSDAPVAGA